RFRARCCWRLPAAAARAMTGWAAKPARARAESVARSHREPAARPATPGERLDPAAIRGLAAAPAAARPARQAAREGAAARPARAAGTAAARPARAVRPAREARPAP